MIVRAIAAEDRWRMRGYELGGAHAAAVRAARVLASRVRARPGSEILRLLVSALQSGPARGLHAMYRASRRLARPLSRDASFLGGFARKGIRPWDLAVRYASEIPQPRRYRGYWHDRSAHSTVGMLVGVDFVPDAGGHWFIESNLDAALREERSALYDRDPLVANLIDFAAAAGYERLMVLPGNAVALDPRMSAQLAREGAERGLRVTIVHDKFLPGARGPRSLAVPPLEPGTFVVRVRRYHTALDYLIADKRAADRALSVYLRETGDRSFRLPKTGSLEEVFRPAGDEPFPNIVYKYAELDQGQALAFLKARSLDAARSFAARAAAAARPGGLTPVLASGIGRRTGFMQEYVRAVPNAERRLFILRAHVLLSPLGARFLSAHRVVSGARLPESLPDGVVAEPRPFLVNYSAGARYEPVSREEEESVARAVAGVAAGLSRAIETGFDTGSPADAAGAFQRTNERKT